MQQVAVLRETEHQRHVVQHIDDGNDVDDLVTHHLADDSGTGAGLHSQRVATAVAATALDAAAVQHGDTQYHALLQHQRQDEQQHGAGDTHRGVAHGHLAVLDNGAAHADDRLDNGSHLLATHGLGDAGQCGEHRLVAHHHAHVTVQRHVALLAAPDVLGEVARDVQDAVARLAVHRLLGLLHVGGITGNSHLLGGVHAAHQVAAHGGAVVIDDNDTLVTHHLGVVDQGIQHGVERVEHQEEDDHALVAEHEHQLAAAHLQHLYAPQEQSAMFQFLTHIIRARTRDSCTLSSTATTAAWAGW